MNTAILLHSYMFKIAGGVANSVDPDQIPHSVCPTTKGYYGRYIISIIHTAFKGIFFSAEPPASLCLLTLHLVGHCVLWTHF